MHVRHGAVALSKVSIRVGDWLSGTAETLQFRAPDVAVFTCIEGREIRAAVAPGASPAALELYTLGSALGIIHFQRGDFPLHGAFLADRRGAYGICGAAGEGKSTLGFALARRGRDLLADDVAIVRANHGAPRVHAESAHLKLWEESARHFALPVHDDARVDDQQAKYYIPIPKRAPAAPPVLRALVFLESGAGEARLEPLASLEALAALRSHTYRPFLVSALGLDQRHLDYCASLLKSVRMYRFQRPRGLRRVEEDAALLARALGDAAA